MISKISFIKSFTWNQTLGWCYSPFALGCSENGDVCVSLFFQLESFEINNGPSSFISRHLCEIKLCQELPATEPPCLAPLSCATVEVECCFAEVNNVTHFHLL